MEKQQGFCLLRSFRIPFGECSSASSKTPKSHLPLILLCRLSHHGLQYLQHWCSFFCNPPNTPKPLKPKETTSDSSIWLWFQWLWMGQLMFFSKWVSLWRKEMEGNYIDSVSQGLTNTPAKGAVQLDITHRFLTFMVDYTQVCLCFTTV